MNASQLIAGYTAYTTAEEFGATAQGDAPATTPLTVTTVSSPECTAFSVSAASGVLTSVSITHAAGC
ncbi:MULTISPECIES: LxmA leader domain family RiPP [unclassified Streptomyces]|uniref:LxmA leader domain family RiPP n=1 Tax=unclassified Streptomyces TaxID=2593676 RepID=UPI002E2FA116|nr:MULTISPECIES: LxmA leader domain family RiPP [unclassified Streptomyces]WUC69155.1 LxmA leader domain family RiPP [Streptomyces sp. NBC_00539]